MNHASTHLFGSIVLSTVALKLPDANGLIAGIAALGLFLSGMAQILKQAVELYRAGGPPQLPPAAH